MDNYELAKKLLKALNDRFPEITAVTSPLLEPGIVNHYLADRKICAFEFFLGDSDRYICFAIEHGKEIFFTRPKEGVMNHLARSLRTKDFLYLLDGELGSRSDLVTKFMETALNRVAQSYIENTICDNAYSETDNLLYHFTYGFKVTSINYHEGTYTADVEFTLKRVGSENWYTFVGTIRENVWAKIYNQDTKKEFNDLKTVFEFMSDK